MALFFALGTQWKRTVMVGLGTSATMLQGLDYAAVEVTARLSDIRLTPALFRDIQIMERAAIREAAR